MMPDERDKDVVYVKPLTEPNEKGEQRIRLSGWDGERWVDMEVDGALEYVTASIHERRVVVEQ